MKISAAALALAFLVALPAGAQEQPDSEGGRYMLREVDGEYLRVDRESGDTSICRRGDVGWTCSLVADDREAYEAELARLSEENAELARQVDALRQDLAAARDGDVPALEGQEPAGPRAERDGSDNKIILDLPSDEDLEQLSQTFEAVMRRFIEMLRSLKEDLEGAQN